MMSSKISLDHGYLLKTEKLTHVLRKGYEDVRSDLADSTVSLCGRKAITYHNLRLYGRLRDRF